MDDNAPLGPVEIQEIKSCTTRNRATTAALVMASLLMFTFLVKLLNGDFDSKPANAIDMAADRDTYVLIAPDSLRNGITFYDADSYGQWPSVTSPNAYTDQVVTITAKNGCDTKYGAYQLVISGLTPGGNYTIQTDTDHYGNFAYGIGGYANKYGQATYKWNCYDEFGMLPEGSYGVLVTDRKTGFANVTYLTVGLASYGK